jgi:hypothetical protein
MDIRMYFAFYLPPLIQLEWRLSACIPRPKTKQKNEQETDVGEGR